MSRATFNLRSFVIQRIEDLIDDSRLQFPVRLYWREVLREVICLVPGDDHTLVIFLLDELHNISLVHGGVNGLPKPGCHQ